MSTLPHDRGYVDPGYGDPRAPLGTEDWAKRWRLVFQGAVKRLPLAPTTNHELYKIGVQYRAWTLLTNRFGDRFSDFNSFCLYPQPWGLGMEPSKFHAYLEAELGKKTADLATVAPGEDKGGAPAGNQNAAKVETGDGEEGSAPETTEIIVSPVVSLVMSTPKEKRLRAILRAPELVQDLYREGLLPQTTAAKLGPKAPTAEEAGRVVEARQALEALDRNKPPREFRKEAKVVVGRIMGCPVPTALEIARKAVAKLTPEELKQLLDEFTARQ